MSDTGPNLAQLTRKIASFAVPGVTEPKAESHLLFKSLEDAVLPKQNNSDEQKRRLQRMRAEARRRENELGFAQIESLGFNLFTTEEIDALSVVDINRPEKDGAHTVRDLHLGPHNESQICETCSGDFRSCYGHYGKINLPKLMHPLAISHIILVLSCVCNSCGGLLLSESDIVTAEINRLTGLRKLQAIKELTSRLSKGCNRYQNVPGVSPCQGGIPIYGSVKEMTTVKDYKLPYKFSKKGTKMFRSPNEIYKILDSISDSDAELLGFVHDSHPRSLIIDRFLVIPYCARPDLYTDDHLHPDDISTIYSDIVKKSNQYFDPSVPVTEKENIIKELYFSIRHFMRNEGGLYKQGTNKIYTDITTRLQGKTGLIRAHMMGKRVNFAGRTVAAPGGYLRVDEIGVPEAMCVRLTRPVMVTELNRAELQSKYESRRVLYIIPRAGKFAGNRIMITNQFVQENLNYQIQIGDTVERTLQEGDIVLANRQPTLHRQSVLALRVKPVKMRAILANLSITSPLNLDFDGDELNIHVPQTIEAYAEAEQLLSIQNSLMNEQTNSPMMGIVYNALTGATVLTTDKNTAETRQAYLTALEDFENARIRLQEYRRTVPDAENVDPEELTRFGIAETKLRRAEKDIGMLDELVFNQCLIYVADRPQFNTLQERVRSEGGIWGTGKALISAAFPEDFYYNAKGVLIRNGVLLEGTLTKATIGRVDGSIITEITKQIDATATVDFMSDIQIVTREYLQHFHGFSVSLDDCYIDDPGFEGDLEKEVAEAEIRVLALSGPTTNQIQSEARERKITKALDIVKSVGDKIAVRKLRADNNLLIMANSGSKGTTLNIAQMSSLLGQAKVNNKRIPASLPGNRALPVFRPGDQAPRARGFCQSSFYSGLAPDELFFHAMGGREGVTDTAINTSNTGQLSHNLIKAAEDVHVSGDGSIRAADGGIIQFVYGNDGFNAGELGTVKIRGQSIPFFRNLNQLADKISAKYGA